mgnify:CR=1 FL=1
MTSIEDRLARQPLLASLDEEQLEVVAGCARDVAFAEGEDIIRAEQNADRFFVIDEGRVAISVDTPRGPLTISTIGAGDVLGVSWMLPPYRWTFDGVAAVPTTAIQFDATCLRGKCDADPRLGYALYTALAGIVRDRLVAARLQLMDLYGDADHR